MTGGRQPSGLPLDEVEHGLRRWFAGEPERASVSFVGVEPISILRFPRADGTTSLVSLGMSRVPLPSQDGMDDARASSRAELCLDGFLAPDAWRQFAVLAAAPAVEGAIYRLGVSVDLGVALGTGSRCTGGLLATSEIPPVKTRHGDVTILRILPATPDELAWTRVHGSQALRRRWTDENVDLRDFGRGPVNLAHRDNAG